MMAFQNVSYIYNQESFLLKRQTRINAGIIFPIE